MSSNFGTKYFEMSRIKFVVSSLKWWALKQLKLASTWNCKDKLEKTALSKAIPDKTKFRLPNDMFEVRLNVPRKVHWFRILKKENGRGRQSSWMMSNLIGIRKCKQHVPLFYFFGLFYNVQPLKSNTEKTQSKVKTWRSRTGVSWAFSLVLYCLQGESLITVQ